MPRRRKPATFQPIDPLILQRYAICMTAIQQGVSLPADGRSARQVGAGSRLRRWLAESRNLLRVAQSLQSSQIISADALFLRAVCGECLHPSLKIAANLRGDFALAGIEGVLFQRVVGEI